MSTVATIHPELVAVRQCMNCGRPQDHPWHDRDYGALANGCSYDITQPQTLWDAVLRPALMDAARAASVDDTQTYREILRWARARPTGSP